MQELKQPPAAGTPRGGGEEEDALYRMGPEGVLPEVGPEKVEIAETGMWRTPEPTPVPVVIEINGVGLTVLASFVDVTDLSVCCVLPDTAVSVRLPASTDVKLTVGGIPWQVVFVGGWHTLPTLGVTIVVFPMADAPPVQKP